MSMHDLSYIWPIYSVLSQKIPESITPNVHILYILETKLKESFPTAQFAIEGFNKLRAIVRELIPFLTPDGPKGRGETYKNEF